MHVPNLRKSPLSRWARQRRAFAVTDCSKPCGTVVAEVIAIVRASLAGEEHACGGESESVIF